MVEAGLFRPPAPVARSLERSSLSLVRDLVIVDSRVVKCSSKSKISVVELLASSEAEESSSVDFDFLPPFLEREGVVVNWRIRGICEKMG